MTPEEALAILDAILKPQCLNDIQELVFFQSLQGKSYQEIAAATDYNADYLKDVGAKLWRQLSQVLEMPVTKRNLYSVITKYLRNSKNLEKLLAQSPQQLNSTINKYLETIDNYKSDRLSIDKYLGIDWQETMDVSIFYGRTEELNTLKQWICQENCRLVAIVGIAGIGKTALTVKLVKQIYTHFEYIIWQNLHHPVLIEKLIKTTQTLSNHREIQLPISPQEQITYFINYLQHHCCLIILDNFDSLFQSGYTTGTYSQEYLDYRELLQKIAEINHKSCLILTSREEPSEVALLAGDTLPTRVLMLAGLSSVVAQEILKIKGITGTANQTLQVVNCYQRNPLLLKIAATSIQDLFSGSAAEFLEQRTIIFQGIRDLLNHSFNRLSIIEKKIMYWLAIEPQPVTTSRVIDIFAPRVPATDSLAALESLRRRFLLEKAASGFMQQPVIKEYMTEKLIEQVYQEMAHKGEFNYPNYSYLLHFVNATNFN